MDTVPRLHKTKDIMMNSIKIQTAHNKNYTSIPNFFIDQFMADANGDFVKIYIWLIKQVDHGAINISITAIADAFNLTETDVVRAMKYWDKHGVIKTSWNDKLLDGILILDHKAKATETTTISASTTDAPKVVAPDVKASVSSHVNINSKPEYTTNDVITFKDNEDFQQLIFVAETYIGKGLNENELKTIISFNSWLKLPFDVIEYLIEYCVSNHKRSLRYMEKVAISWSENQVDSLEKAKWRVDNYNPKYFTIFKAFGIKDRHPVPKEIKLMDKWLNDFPPQIILEACARTIEKTGNPSFSYADTILNAWHESGVKTLDDIEALDIAFKQKKELAGKNKKPQAGTGKSAKKFINYEQRDYDYADIEAQALRKLMSSEGE